MARVARARSASRRRTVVYAVGAALLMLLVVAGVTFVNSISVARVADNARSLHWTNATLGTAALTRAGLAQAATFAELLDNGLVEQDDLTFAMDQVNASYEELTRLASIGPGDASQAELARLLVPVGDAIELIDTGDVERAKAMIRTEIEATYIELINALHIEQDEIQAAIEDNTADGRALNGWVVFLLTLAVPGSAVIVYFVVTRRQVSSLRERSRLELEAERTISRAKDDFIAALSHELRTPLTSIYGFAEILTDGGVQGREATSETAHIIANEAAEMTRMVDDLLTASRLDSTGIEIELAPTQVQQVIAAAVTPFERAGMTINRQPTHTAAMADAARLRHVIVNLLSNAARHGGPKTEIEVSAAEHTVEIAVSDNGLGVPEDRVSTLFEPFGHDGRSALLAGSVGLGLAVASRLTGMMGGSLRYQRFGSRTYFVVSLAAVPVDLAPEDDGTSVASMIRSLAR